ncbi:MerR family transcriptional regulator [Chamaesiphon sp.]|uniref:MerR family transcriptional regulator n=1 Tax=Chamaesiphon sp. TaxID=2814140 RepID=UPI003592FDE8
MNVKQGLFIGELSQRVGIPAQTIRYYERLGLVKPAQRTLSQYRVYTEEDELRLNFIQKAKQFGLSLDEIKKLIDIRAKNILPCNVLKGMVKQHLDELDQRIDQMLAFRQELNNRYEQIQALLPDTSTLPTQASSNSQICGLIEQ